MDVLIAKLEKVIHYYINDEKLSSPFKRILKNLNSVNERRNKYIHSNWSFPKWWHPIESIDGEPNLPIREKVKKKYSGKDIFDRAFVDVKELRGYLRELSLTEKQLCMYIHKHRCKFYEMNKQHFALYGWERHHDLARVFLTQSKHY